MKMNKYCVRVEQQSVYCENFLTVEAETAAEAVLIAKQKALSGDLEVKPVEPCWTFPLVTQIFHCGADYEDDVIAESGIGGDFTEHLDDCLTGFLRAILVAEGVPEHKINDTLKKLMETYRS